MSTTTTTKPTTNGVVGSAVRSLITSIEESDTSTSRARAAMFRSRSDAATMRSYREIATALRSSGCVEPRPYQVDAALTAMRLWADNLRLVKEGRAHVAGAGLGSGVARMPNGDRRGALRRLHLVAATSTTDALARTLPGVVSLLGSHNIGIDFGTLAEQIQSWPFPESRRRTIRTWAIDSAAASLSE